MVSSSQNIAIVHGAHTGTGGQRMTTLPSIFEYLAHESLSGSMKQGIHSVVKLLLHFLNRPHFSFIHNHFDELYLLFQLFLENHFLKKFSASFSENFYGMKRVPLRVNASFSRIGHRIRSLIFIVILPYFYDKLEKMCEKLGLEQDTIRHKGWRRLLLRFYPRLKALFFLLALFFQVAFVFSSSSFPNPLLLLANCRLEKLTSDDLAQFDAERQMPFHLRRTNIFARLWRSLLLFPSILGRFLSYALFLVQFLEYYYSDELGRRFGQLVEGRRNIRIPTHPYNSLPTEQQTLCMEVDKCPICRQIRRNDTVLTVSGYVFCHSCIHNFVRVEGCCPITSIPASSSELVKIYR